MLLTTAQNVVKAQDLTLSDVQNSGCLRDSEYGRRRANETEERRTMILLKEGNILTVQLFNFEATCETEDFIITPKVNNGDPCFVSINVDYIDSDADCICPYNISFTLHDLEPNCFFFSCWWYNGLVNLTEGEPLVLEDIKEDISIDGTIYTLDKVAHTAKLIRKEAGESEVNIPSELNYEGQKYTVTGIGSYVFHSNAALTSITIPGSITYIGEAAFYDCSNLREVCCQADDVPSTGSWVFDNTPIASATLHVPAGSIDKYKAQSPWSRFGNIVGIPQEEYFPEGTKWTEIRLDTLKYDSWYSKVDGEWVPNFETIEYRVLGIYSNFSETFGDNSLKCVYTNCSEWTDSLSLLIVEGKINEYLNYGRRVMATVPIYFDSWDVPSPAMAYNFDWRVGMPISFIDILSTTYDHNSETAVFGIIEEINEGNFGGVRPLSYTDVNGVRFIQGIGVTTWNDGECIFGPVKPYEALSAYGAIEPEERHYRSMLVHFERNGEVLYDVWPRKGSTVEVTIDGLNYFLYLNSHEAVLTNGRNCSGELDIPSEVRYNDETFVVKSMTHNAFHNNSELTKVRIPKTIEEIIHYYPVDPDWLDPPTGMANPIYVNPFKGCTALESIEVDEENPCMKSIDGVLFSQDGVGQYYYKTGSYSGTGLYCYPEGVRQESYTIPESVEWIGGAAFPNNQYLTTLTIPNSMKHICYDAFSGCCNLTDVYCYAENVPIAWDGAFRNVPIASATLHVPAGSIEEYKTTSPWSNFGNIVALPDNPTESLCGEWWLVGWKDSGEWVEVDSKYVRHEHFTIVINEEGFVIAYSMVNEIFVGMLTLNGNEMFFEGGGEMTTALCDLEENLFFEDNICSIKRYTQEGNLLRLYYTDDDYFVFTKNLDSNEKHILAFTKEQMATIILPEEPDASKGKYYRLDRVEDGKIIFEQELQPQAHVPYIIVPDEDFSIDISTLDLAGCYRDTVSVDDVSFIGSYVSEAFDYQEGFYIDIIDTTPDCRFDESCVIGALRAYLLVRWDDSYNQGGTKVPPLEKLEVMLHDNGTGINNINIKDNGYIYDLQGRKIAKPQKGINIIRYSDGTTRKVLVK